MLNKNVVEEDVRKSEEEGRKKEEGSRGVSREERGVKESGVRKVEMRGIDPLAPRMRSECSTI